MKTNYKRIAEFVSAANHYTQAYPQETKLRYAIVKVGERVNKVTAEYNSLRGDLEIDHANTDSNGSLLYKVVEGKREYDYTKDGFKALQKARLELLENKEFDIEPYYATELPEDFPAEYIQYFEGFVIRPDNDKNG